MAVSRTTTKRKPTDLERLLTKFALELSEHGKKIDRGLDRELVLPKGTTFILSPAGFYACRPKMTSVVVDIHDGWTGESTRKGRDYGYTMPPAQYAEWLRRIDAAIEREHRWASYHAEIEALRAEAAL
jgi:hypothetical protein